MSGLDLNLSRGLLRIGERLYEVPAPVISQMRFLTDLLDRRTETVIRQNAEIKLLRGQQVHWSAGRKRAVALLARGRPEIRAELCARFEISPEELADWIRDLPQGLALKPRSRA